MTFTQKYVDNHCQSGGGGAIKTLKMLKSVSSVDVVSWGRVGKKIFYGEWLGGTALLSSAAPINFPSFARCPNALPTLPFVQSAQDLQPQRTHPSSPQTSASTPDTS